MHFEGRTFLLLWTGCGFIWSRTSKYAALYSSGNLDKDLDEIFWVLPIVLCEGLEKATILFVPQYRFFAAPQQNHWIFRGARACVIAATWPKTTTDFSRTSNGAQACDLPTYYNNFGKFLVLFVVYWPVLTEYPCDGTFLVAPCTIVRYHVIPIIWKPSEPLKLTALTKRIIWQQATEEKLESILFGATDQGTTPVVRR